MRTDTVGVVLAGGLARRMGGGDKPLRWLGGRSVLDRVLDALRPAVPSLAINANGDAARFAAWGLPVIADGMPDHPGPLAGILAAMDWAAGLGVPWAVTVTGDAPFLPDDLAPRLHDARERAGARLACAASGGRTHPPIGLWAVALRDELRRDLLAGERKIDRWTARQGCAVAEWPADPFDPFENLNTPEDFEDAERRLAGRSGRP